MLTSTWTRLALTLCATATFATQARAQAPITSYSQVLTDLNLASDALSVLRVVTKSNGFKASPTRRTIVSGNRDVLGLVGRTAVLTTEPFVQVSLIGEDTFARTSAKYNYTATVTWYGPRTSKPAGLKISRLGSFSLTVVLDPDTRRLALNPTSASDIFEAALGVPFFNTGNSFPDALAAFGFAALDCDRNCVGFSKTKTDITVSGVPEVTFTATAGTSRQGVLKPDGAGNDTLRFANSNDFDYRLCATLSGRWNNATTVASAN